MFGKDNRKRKLCVDSYGSQSSDRSKLMASRGGTQTVSASFRSAICAHLLPWSSKAAANCALRLLQPVQKRCQQRRQQRRQQKTLPRLSLVQFQCRRGSIPFKTHQNSLVNFSNTASSPSVAPTAGLVVNSSSYLLGVLTRPPMPVALPSPSPSASPPALALPKVSSVKP